jgi:hypothetical protein
LLSDGSSNRQKYPTESLLALLGIKTTQQDVEEQEDNVDNVGLSTNELNVDEVIIDHQNHCDVNEAVSRNNSTVLSKIDENGSAEPVKVSYEIPVPLPRRQSTASCNSGSTASNSTSDTSKSNSSSTTSSTSMSSSTSSCSSKSSSRSSQKSRHNKKSASSVEVSGNMNENSCHIIQGSEPRLDDNNETIIIENSSQMQEQSKDPNSEDSSTSIDINNGPVSVPLIDGKYTYFHCFLLGAIN